MTVLMNANRQWESRPADERFGSLRDMHNAAVAHRSGAKEATIDMRGLIVKAAGADIKLIGATDRPAALTHWAFGQLASKVKAPASYLRTLPTELVAQCLNNGLRAFAGDDADAARAAILADKSLTIRALTSDKYSRIWNADVTKRLLELEAEGPWQPAPAAFDGSRGLYLGDQDMFAFMVDNERRIFEKGPAGGLSRGFFCWNSEVGGGSIGVSTFLYEYVCGNHRVWGAQQVEEMRIAHIYTDAPRAFAKLSVELKKYSDTSAAGDEAKIETARRFEIGATKEETLDAVFKLRIAGLAQKTVTAAYDLVDTQRADWYGSPRSAWGLAGGMTEIARDLPNANDRLALDKAATKVMEMAA